MASRKGKWGTSCAEHAQESLKLRCSVMAIEYDMNHTDPDKLVWVFGQER